MSNLDSYAISVLTGSKRTSRSHFKPVRAHLQGTEITSIHGYRSVLPIVGRNQRYSVFDTALTASVSDKNYFTDVESCNDAGLGQDTYEVFTGTRYNVSPFVIDGVINTNRGNPIINAAAINLQRIYANRLGRTLDLVTGSFLDNIVESEIRTFLERSRKGQWQLGKAYISGSTHEEVYYVSGSYNSVTKADVKFPNGRVRQTISFKLQSEDIGYGKEYIDSVPYFDLAKYDAESYVREDGPTGMFPIVGSFISYDEKLSYNGIVEPFEIRRRALGLNIFLEDDRQPGTVFAESTANHSPVFNYDSRENDQRAEFFEDVHVKGFAGFGDPLSEAQALLEPEFVSAYSKHQYPYVERDETDLLIADPGVKSVQLSMDPTLDEGILPETHLDMAVGFDAKSRDRHNSLVYRGMKRR